MGGLDDYKPALAMLALQFSYAGIALFSRGALLEGMSPRVFVVYRQAIATLVIAPLAYFTRRGKGTTCLGLKSFCMIFLVTLVGVTINQNIYFEGLYLASSTMGSAMGNLVPAITFVLASIMGLEKLKMRSLRSNAKIIGTVMCVGGAVSMALFRGPKLLNSQLLPPKSLLGSGGDGDWLLGCFLLFGSSCCWSVWLILQVPVSAIFPDHLSLTAWMCFMAAIQSASVTVFLEPNPEAWKLNSFLQLGCCLFSGIVGSAVSFFVQAWCISRRGPLFSAMFNPLGTVIVTIFAAIFLHEEIYTGSLIGGVGVIAGLYAVLWGKAKNLEETSNVESNPKMETDQTKAVQILVDESSDRSCKIDLEEPLLAEKNNKS
ncbi:WAT1-related protein [Actinidia chinensis var. chinensis]|uniref:WAT1-related protein n=1 Tax=Actinidia chinensis var. chinensis TaxID=1590841 RepID=A0A2R6Q8T8_ACTCC|nr:WAT1-related protein [Actinidia chinensis var. chinensis]